MLKKSLVRLSVGAVILFLTGAGCNNSTTVTPETSAPAASVSVSSTAPNAPVLEAKIKFRATKNTASSAASVKSFNLTAKSWEFSPSVITVNKGDTVKLTITSLDEVHGFTLPDFGIRVNLEPGKATPVEFVASQTGAFTFFCSVFCGDGHSAMRGQLIVK